MPESVHAEVDYKLRHVGASLRGVSGQESFRCDGNANAAGTD